MSFDQKYDREVTLGQSKKGKILAPLSISVVASNPKNRAWKDKNLSGSYIFVETVNDRPVYKVRLLFPIHSCDNRIISFLFSAKPNN